MISLSEAFELTLSKTNILGTETVTISECGGFVLAEDVFSDVSMPPFDKSMMDGYAVRSADCEKVPVTLKIVETIPAGYYPKVVLKPGQASKIMTGAPIPEGADTVQMVEKTEQIATDQVKIFESIPTRKHIAYKSEVMVSGSVVIKKGSVLSPGKIGVLASVGKSSVKIYKRPRVAILVTGSELVEINEKPGTGQIRNSNGYALYEQALNAGCLPTLLSIASDELEQLKANIELGLQSDVLLISGGVSMGEFDLVKDVLDDLGIEFYFDKINIKPGKPTVFGVKDNTLIFGLPGNPVSASTIFELIVRPALRKTIGHAQLSHRVVTAVLGKDFNSRTKRECYYPAFVRYEENNFFAAPIKSKGSADIVAFANSNSFIVTNETKQAYEKGELITAVLRNDFWQ